MIRALKVELHHPGVRCSVTRLQQLLHKDFHEIGRSGSVYHRETIVCFLGEQKVYPSVASDEFPVAQLASEFVLLTYRSALRKLDVTLENHTLRSSVWMMAGESWQLRYHQGTPAAVP